MTDYTIVTDEKLLRVPSEPVVSPEEGLEIAERLIEVALKAGGQANVLGLAAPQVGIYKRVFITWGSTGVSHEEGWNVYINPVLEDTVSSVRTLYEEGCLSFPYAKVRTHRNTEIVVSNLEEDGERHRYALSGLEAIVFQHELDHLDGILMFDRVAKSVPADANGGKDKIGRNDSCPCGSGKKYKKCCGG